MHGATATAMILSVLLIGGAREESSPGDESESTAIERSADAETVPEPIAAWQRLRQHARERERLAGLVLSPWRPMLLATLDGGSSVARREALAIIEDGGLLPLLNVEHIVHFARCASDPEARVRATATRLAMERWILTAPVQHPDAIEFALAMSHDPSPEVRRVAIWDGLAAVLKKNDEVVKRLMALRDATTDPEMRQRIHWGLRAHGDQVRMLRARE